MKTSIMTVEEALPRMGEAPVESAIVAQPPFTWGTEAMIVDLEDDGSVPGSTITSGFRYLIDRDELLPLLDHLKTKKVSGKTSAEFVIHHAVYDCAPAWIDDIPDIGE